MFSVRLTNHRFNFILFQFVVNFLFASGFDSLNNDTTATETIIDSVMFESVFHTSAQRRAKRDSSFINFAEKNNEMLVKMSFDIPVVEIPIRKSITGAQDLATAMMNRTPLANLNGSAIAISLLAIIGMMYYSGYSKYMTGAFFGIGPTKNNFNTWLRSDDSVTDKLESLMYMLEHSMNRYNLDASACSQRVTCWMVKNSMVNVANGRANQMDRIIEDVTRAEWAKEFIQGTPIDEAIHVGRDLNNCEKTYSSCLIRS